MICDFAQYYHVLNWRGLPLRLAATLAFGLPEDSRVKRRGSAFLAGTDTVLLAKIVDLLTFWVWGHTKDGQQGFNRPPSVLDRFMVTEDRPMVFVTGEEFDAYYQQLASKARGE